jgi:Type ISP C-terminal specificity domain/N-6 DNA Methylase
MDDDWSALPINSAVETVFQSLLNNPGFRQWTEQELMVQLAARARLLSDTVKPLLDAPTGSGATLEENKLIKALHDLWALIREHHDPSLAELGACSDFIAQVLLFGLFFAHTQISGDEKTVADRHAHISDFWLTKGFENEAKKLRPFHTISVLLNDSLKSDNDLSGWYQDTIAILAHADYMGTSGGPTDYHSLFEKFFEAFDNKTRFDRGVFYTPTALTTWMSATTDGLIYRHFGGHLVDLAEKVIDPCCGTGGFLEALINTLGFSETKSPLFVGFEVLPGPYALAQYRLHRIIKGTPHKAQINLFLTDTLSDQLADSGSSATDGFSIERAEAGTMAKIPLRVVIGNPPSSTHVASKAPRKLIEEAMEVFRPPKSECTDRQNVQKATNNEAYRFLRWCSQKVLDSGKGILSLVLPGSFAYAVSLKYVRKWLMNHFQNVYVILIDADARTGANTDSLFKVQQGRLAVFAILNPTLHNANVEGIQHGEDIGFLDISAKKLAEKIEFLNDVENGVQGFQPLHVDSSTYNFTPTWQYEKQAWDKSWPLRNAYNQTGFFISKCSAIKLAPSSLLFHTEKPILIRRAIAVSSKNKGAFVEYKTLKSSWWEGQSKPPTATKFTEGVRTALGKAVTSPTINILRYSYRPFVNGFVIANDNIFEELGKTAGNGTRKRSEVRAAFDQGACGLAVAPGPLDLGGTLTRFVSFIWHLPDNDLAARGNAMVYCNRFPEEQKQAKWDPTAKTNVCEAIKDLFEGPDPDLRSLFYAYGIMSSPAYLSAFESVLYTSANPEKPPKIPIIADPKIRTIVTFLGRIAAQCEREDYEVPIPSGVSLIWKETSDEFSLQKENIDVEKGTISLMGMNGEAASINGINPEVLTTRISGHMVVSKWLRERHFVYLRRTFRHSDLDDLVSLISRITLQIKILERISVFLRRALDENDLLGPPVVKS